MKTKLRLLLVPLALFTVLTLMLISTPGSKTAESATPGNKVLAHALAVELGQAKLRPKEALVSSGVVYTLLQASGVIDQRARAAKGPAAQFLPSKAGTVGCQNVYTSTTGGPSNIRVNQDCSLRRQAEEVIAINPTNVTNLIAGQNDSRIGYNHCGYDWSFSSGKTWGDQVPPFYQYVLLDGHTADACSDPTATFDSVGNAYIGGVLFDINSVASAFIVMKSNAGIGGAFYHTPDSTQAFQTYLDTPVGVVASDNDPNIFNDKEFIVADSVSTSPKHDNVYATWTRFNGATGQGVGGNSPIYFSQSTDGGKTWSPGIEISGANTTFCTAFSGEANPNACDQDQGSDPVVGPDGTLYVAFGNGNTPTAGINQHMVVKCPASADCTNPASWMGPYKISDDYGTQPVGPDGNGCPSGRQCLPPNGYRMDDFVEGSISVDARSRLYFAWGDFRNGQPNCMGNTATATPPCDNDVFYSYSTNGGVTWSAAYNLTADALHPTAQWMPWSAVAPSGSTYYVAYYDRSYDACETTGCNDITLAKVTLAATGNPTVTKVRVTTSSMPNLTLANNPVQAGFLGDYMWVATDRAGRAYIVWADTRGLNGTVEEDIYYANVSP